MARAFTSLGVAGLLVAILLPGGIGLMGGAASAPTQREVLDVGAAASQAPAFNAGAPAGASLGASADPDAPMEGNASIAIAAGEESPDVRDGDTKVDAGGDLLAAEAPPNPLLIGSIALLALGILLFGLRFAARRLR